MQKSESEITKKSAPQALLGRVLGLQEGRKENYFFNSGPPQEVITCVLGILVALSEAVGYSQEANK